MIPIFGPRMIQRQPHAAFPLTELFKNHNILTHQEYFQQDNQETSHKEELSQIPPGSIVKVQGSEKEFSFIGVTEENTVIVCDNEAQILEWYNINDIQPVEYF